MLKKQITIPSGPDYSEWFDLSFYVDKTDIISQISGAFKKNQQFFLLVQGDGEKVYFYLQGSITLVKNFIKKNISKIN